jgi:GNAT superfamily N-acetyltransferase
VPTSAIGIFCGVAAPLDRPVPRPYVVRLAGASDVEQICEVCREGFDASSRGLLRPETIRRQVEDYYSPDQVRREVDPSGSPKWQGYVVAATADGQVLGAGGGGVLDGTSGQVYVLYLRLRLRGMGIGTAILDFLTGQQQEAGAVDQWVSVTEGNELAIPFYLARGFTQRDRVPFVRDGAGRIEAYSLRMVRTVRAETRPAPGPT